MSGNRRGERGCESWMGRWFQIARGRGGGRVIGGGGD